ncbi:acetyl/propionyl/methylcrotonyl-CoA carboxylase subunit alpha [Frankia sp. CcWB2]
MTFSSVLVANRGEIAVRVIRTLRDLGIRSIAVYSDPDAGARHVREADVAVRLGPAPAKESYLSIEAVLEAARVSGAEAVHPGYGFLAENAAFVQACETAGVLFIGPSLAAVQVMGNKITARRTVAEVGVPVVPGRSAPGMSDAAIAEAAGQIGYPVLLKPSAGGGGKGMRIVREPARLPEAIASARREAAAGFGDDTLYVERFITRPRHIEVQILADEHGSVLHLGERECSLQRRHQKIVEEAPAPALDARTRERLGAAAVAVASAVGYVGAGTVEFILSADAPDEFYFMEMNTRLQVEHPVTELVTGVDLVAEQIRIAAGEPLRFGQADIRLTGHAVEARIYAEDPGRGFLPTGGRVLAFREPAGPAIRVDAGIGAGDIVSTTYDPILAKVIAWGADRAAAIARLDTALAGTVLLGVTTNIGFLRSLLAHPDVVAGRLDTGLVERDLAALTPGDLPGEALLGYALARLLALQPTGPVVDPWDIPSGWRPGEPAWLTWDVALPGGAVPSGGPDGAGSGGSASPEIGAGAGAEGGAGNGHGDGNGDGGGNGDGDGAEPGGGERAVRTVSTLRVAARGTPDAARVRIADGPPVAASVSQLGDELLVTIGAVTTRWAYAWEPADGILWLGRDGGAWGLAEVIPVAGTGAGPVLGGQARSPMPGTVTAVLVEPGMTVADGQSLVVVEAMKMEHTVSAAGAGIVKEVLVRPGDLVALDQLLVVMSVAGPAGPGSASAAPAARRNVEG